MACVAALLAIAAITTAPTAASAQGDEPAPTSFSPKVTPEAKANPDLAKVTNDLLAAENTIELATGVTPVLGPVITWRGGMPEIEVTFSELTPAVEAAVKAAGFVADGTYPEYKMMAGRIDPARLDELAAITEVVHVRPNYGARTSVGLTTSQADSSIGADAARAAVGVDGSGVHVGVLSDSFNANSVGSTTGAGCASATTGTASQLSGDVPTSVGNLTPIQATGSDEGRAMMELIHDLAPGASQTFRTAFVSEADFATGIADLVTCGADVIVDDVGYLTEPMFQDGLIAQAADAAHASGVPYFSAAGNSATFGVNQVFNDSAVADDTLDPPSQNDFHDFEPGAVVDTTIPITIPAGAAVTFVLQWNQPFLSGGIGPGAGVDLDLYICTDASCAGAGVSNGVQGCSPATPAGDPFEAVTATAGAAPFTVWLAVEHYCGSQVDTHFRIATFFDSSATSWGTTSVGTAVFDQPQIVGHAAAAGAMAVAAVDYREIDAGGAHEGGPEINSESFTSLGGNLPFYFGPTGAPLSGAPVTRFKPDIAAPDGTNTTFFGSSDPELDGYPNFYGTSAAAPHAAAVAALMLEAQPSLTPDEVYARLKDTALDIDSVGVDTISGNGLIQAQIAVPPSYELTLLPSPCPLYDSTSATGGLSGAIPGNTSRTVQVSGSLPAAQGVGTHSCVPAGASGVLYTISVLSPQRVGNLRLSEEGVVANGGVVNYADNGLNNGNTVAVPLGASGKADIYANVGATDVRLVAVGYYSDSGTLNYTPVTPCAVADSRTSENPTGSYVGPFAPGAAYPDVDVVGTFPAGQGGGNTDCGIPAAADAVVVNLVSVNSASGSGYLAAGTGGTSPTEQATAFASLGMNNAATVVVPLTATGTVAVDVFGTSGTPTTEIRLVVLGYLDQATGSGYTPVNPCAAFDSRTGLGASGSFLGLRNSGVATTYQIAGTGLANQGGGNGGSCGVPVGATAVLINLVGVESVQAGNYRAYATGTTPTGGVLNFAPLVPAMNNSNAVVVPLDSLGQMDLFVNTHNNNGTGTTHARGVVLGYYRGTSPGVGD